VRLHGNRWRPFEERFWEKVDKRGPDECWMWIGSRRRNGYGQIAAEYDGVKLRVLIASRASWELAHGRPVPDGMQVCHHCDNPPCVNPAHLFLGSARDNAQDALKKGRVGKLTDAEVATIRNRREAGEPGVVLAREFGVSAALVSRIVRGTRRIGDLAGVS
jgi:HNH endonuclease